MISWLAGLATGISAARLSSWIYHIRQRRYRRAFARFADPRLGVPFDEGRVQRGNGSGGPTTPKPPIKPQFPSPRIIPGDTP